MTRTTISWTAFRDRMPPAPGRYLLKVPGGSVQWVYLWVEGDIGSADPALDVHRWSWSSSINDGHQARRKVTAIEQYQDALWALPSYGWTLCPTCHQQLGMPKHIDTGVPELLSDEQAATMACLDCRTEWTVGLAEAVSAWLDSMSSWRTPKRSEYGSE